MHHKSWPILFALICVAAACAEHETGKFDPQFDPPTMKPMASDTVARGTLQFDLHRYDGLVSVRDPDDPSRDPTFHVATIFPFPITRPMLRRGQRRYNIFCAPCHARTGNGDGLVARHGFDKPPSFHTEAQRRIKVGDLYRVIRHGKKSMPAFEAQIPTDDRWKIVAYLRALQRSQHATLADAPPRQRQRLERDNPQKTNSQKVNAQKAGSSE